MLLVFSDSGALCNLRFCPGVIKPYDFNEDVGTEGHRRGSRVRPMTVLDAIFQPLAGLNLCSIVGA